jgi:hypothetical protein
LYFKGASKADLVNKVAKDGLDTSLKEELLKYVLLSHDYKLFDFTYELIVR